MIKVHTIGMLEHNAKSFPDIKAHADMLNGAIVGLGDGVTTSPASGKKLYIVMNNQTGDEQYADNFPVKKDEYVNLFELSVWEGQELDVTESNIKYNLSETYASLTNGKELTFDPDTFKLKIGTATAGDINFTVTKKFGSSVNGITVKIGVK